MGKDTMREKEFEQSDLDVFREASNRLGACDEYFGYAHFGGYDTEKGVYSLCRHPLRVSTQSNFCEVLFEGSSLDEALAFIESYEKGLELGIKAMAGVPERLSKLFPLSDDEAEDDD